MLLPSREIRSKNRLLRNTEYYVFKKLTWLTNVTSFNARRDRVIIKFAYCPCWQ
jgi:hypothetical protein